jgi:hypothetical protein
MREDKEYYVEPCGNCKRRCTRSSSARSRAHFWGCRPGVTVGPVPGNRVLVGVGARSVAGGRGGWGCFAVIQGKSIQQVCSACNPRKGGSLSKRRRGQCVESFGPRFRGARVRRRAVALLNLCWATLTGVSLQLFRLFAGLLRRGHDGPLRCCRVRERGVGAGARIPRRTS